MNTVHDRFVGAYPGHAYGTEEEPTRLLARLSALDRMAEAAAGRLPEEYLVPARELLDRADARLRTAPRHSAVVIAGATGSGKSSLFNALVGLDLSPVGVRRPTTTGAVSCAWDPDGAGPLLDLLGLPRGRRIPRHGVLDDAGPLRDPVLSRLVLIDLPDHDSVETGHREEVDRYVAAADHLIWVLDPQKYADALVHHAYLRPLAQHADVLTVVLNQTDRLPGPDAVAQVTADLRRILADDGLADVRVIATSAATGDGVRELRDAVAGVAASRRTALLRLSADLDHLTASFDPVFTGVVPGADTFDAPVRERLVDGIAGAAGIGAGGRGRGTVYPIHVHEVDLAVRHAALDLVRDLPRPWATGVREALAHGGRRVPEALRAELATPVGPAAAAPARVRAAAAALWVGVALTLLGVAGIALALAGAEPVGRVDGWYAALAPLAVGVLLALGALYAGEAWRAEADRERRIAAERELRARAAGVADEYLVDPATVELERYREAHAFFVAAREPLHVH